MNWQRNPDIQATILPDGFVALSTGKTEWVHILNPVGALVWELADGELSAEQMIAQIQELIQSKDQIALRNDIDQFTKELAAQGLLSCK